MDNDHGSSNNSNSNSNNHSHNRGRGGGGGGRGRGSSADFPSSSARSLRRREVTLSKVSIYIVFVFVFCHSVRLVPNLYELYATYIKEVRRGGEGRAMYYNQVDPCGQPGLPNQYLAPPQRRTNGYATSGNK